MRHATALLALALLCACATAGESDDQPAPRTHSVTIAQMRFEPSDLEVRKGDTIKWANADLVPHTVTNSGGAFDSGTLAPDATWQWTAGTPGDIPYVCTLHPTMSGRIRVR